MLNVHIIFITSLPQVVRDIHTQGAAQQHDFLFESRLFRLALHLASSSSVGQPSSLVQGRTAAPSVSMASSCPPAVSRSFTMPPCGLSAQPTRLCLWWRWGEGPFSCLIPLVLNNTGPGPQSPLNP